jgi:hypothetical protein
MRTMHSRYAVRVVALGSSERRGSSRLLMQVVQR